MKNVDDKMKIIQGHSIVKYIINTEKAVKYMEQDNKLLVSVGLKATKAEIKEAMENIFNVKVQSVNTYITNKGEKRAYVKLSLDNPAMDIITKLGLM